MEKQNDLEFETKEMAVSVVDEKSIVEVVPASLLESFIDETEKRIECTLKMKRIIFKVTSINDWIDQGGKPYLGAPGAEAVAMAMCIGWDKPNRTIESLDDGHKLYKFDSHFHFLGRTIWVMGSRSSKDPFFGRSGGEDKPADAINMANVEKAAYTNLLNNGIQRILGIRNMTWEMLEESYGIKRNKAASVNYDAKVISLPQGKRMFAIGKSAGWSDDDVAKYLAEMEYSSSKDVLKRDYEAICNFIESNPKH
jgi:hypothetical protein